MSLLRRLDQAADHLVERLVDAYFTKSSLAVHAIVYPTLMGLEGGDFHLFLDGISIEAVFVAVLVGISTKQIRAHTHPLVAAIGRVLWHHGDHEQPEQKGEPR